ncbi:MAG: hypothetical protein ACRDTE_23155, partial [Pseudonocardiaceae bacterium]
MISPARPTATTTTSAAEVTAARFVVREWQTVTVALRSRPGSPPPAPCHPARRHSPADLLADGSGHLLGPSDDVIDLRR